MSIVSKYGMSGIYSLRLFIASHVKEIIFFTTIVEKNNKTNVCFKSLVILLHCKILLQWCTKKKHPWLKQTWLTDKHEYTSDITFN